MSEQGWELLAPDRARELVETAEWVREELAKSVGYQVKYDSSSLQLLDEWIEKVVSKSADPPRRLRLVWSVFLGEVFRRRYNGQWVLHRTEDEALGVVCPSVGGELHLIDVAEQVRRRIANGFADSIALFYNQKGFVLMARDE